MKNWPATHMERAHLAARESKDTTKVGAVLVGPDGRARLLDAYNGPPAGVADLPERFERPAKYLYASHAEANLIAFAARHGIRTEGCMVYCTHAPCASCARTMIQAGIVCVVAASGTTSMPPEEFEAARTMLREARVAFPNAYEAIVLARVPTVRGDAADPEVPLTVPTPAT